MSYKILESSASFNADGTLSRLMVLVEISRGDIRAFEATDNLHPGYARINNHKDHNLFVLHQQVAASGLTVPRDRIPAEWLKKYS